MSVINDARSSEAKDLAQSFRKEKAMVSFDEYQAKALWTAVYPDLGRNLVNHKSPAVGQRVEQQRHRSEVW